MNVKLWSNFTKKQNSTKRPADSAATNVEGYFRMSDAFSLYAPNIHFDFSQMGYSATSAPPFTYAEIPDFGRYYWITDWTHDQGVWTASLQVDVLSSFKPYIGAKSMYVLRSSARSNGRVVDSKYPSLTTANSYYDSLGNVTVTDNRGNTETVSNYWSRPYNQGAFILGVYGPNATGMTYYAFTYDTFLELAEKLYDFTPSNMDDVSEGIAKQISNPIQFIGKCLWIPVLPRFSGSSAVSQISFGYYKIVSGGCWSINPFSDMVHCSATLPIRKHPQAASRGVYLNQAPYSKYSLSFYPFGDIELDSTLMVDDQNISLNWDLDVTTGAAMLTVHATNSLLARVKAEIGVPINLSQATVDYMGGVQSVLGTAGSLLGNIMTGNVLGAASAVVGGFSSAASAASPKISSIGGGGDYLTYGTGRAPRIYADFYYIADEDNADVGRPLCEVTTPDSLGGGYIMALEGEVEAPATYSELNEISGYLTGGFFYE